MRDFPVFTTENGVASLVLREIPYRGCAYIKLLNSQDPERLLAECREFCIVVGAEKIYAAGDPCLEKYPLYTTILEMEREWGTLPAADARAVAVTEQNLSQWKGIYNSKMRDVPNAAYMDDAGAKAMLQDASGYFVELDGKTIGICKGAGDTIEAIASVCPGAGKDTVLALCKELNVTCVRLQVADSNTRAVALYSRMGFVKTKEISRWYQIL